MTMIQMRRGTSAEWDAANPVLASGEPGYATDTDVLKIGNGTQTWQALREVSDPALLEAARAARDEAVGASTAVVEATAAYIAVNGAPGVSVDVNGRPFYDPALEASGSATTYVILLDVEGRPYLYGAGEEVLSNDATRLVREVDVDTLVTQQVAQALNGLDVSAQVADEFAEPTSALRAAVATAIGRGAAMRPSLFGFGDGTTTAAAALTAAAAAAVAFGVPLLLGSETYDLGTSKVDLPDRARVFGQDAKIISTSAGNAVLSLGSGNVLEGVEVVNRDTTTGNIGIDWRDNSVRTYVRFCRFTSNQRTQACNIAKAGVAHVYIDRCTFDGVNYGVLSNGMGAGGADDLTQLHVTNCDFERIYGDGIEINHPGAVVGDNTRTSARGIVITGNNISVPRTGYGSGAGSGLAIGIAGASEVSVIGNHILEARTTGIHVEDQAYAVSVLGNTIQNVAGDAVRLLASCRAVTITGNEIDGATGAGINVSYDASQLHSSAINVLGNTVRNVQHGIIASGDGLYSGGQISVLSNIVSDTTGDGVRLRGPADDVQVKHNEVTRCGGYGIDHSQSYARVRTVESNLVTRCTLGDYKGAAASGGFHPTVIRDRTAVVAPAAASDSGALVAVPLFRLGRRSRGNLVLEAYKTDGFLTQYVCDFTWDGSVFDTTLVDSQSYGSVATATNGLSVVNGVLTWTIYTGTAGVALKTVSGQFKGVMTDDGTSPAGTVVAT